MAPARTIVEMSSLFFSPQGWLQHQGAAGFCGAARVRRPEPRPGAKVDWVMNPDWTCAPWLPVTSQIKALSLCLVGSSCGASVCQVKPRRSTEWWRRLRHGTVSATPESSSQQVRHTQLLLSKTVLLYVLNQKRPKLWFQLIATAIHYLHYHHSYLFLLSVFHALNMLI